MYASVQGFLNIVLEGSRLFGRKVLIDGVVNRRGRLRECVTRIEQYDRHVEQHDRHIELYARCIEQQWRNQGGLGVNLPPPP